MTAFRIVDSMRTPGRAAPDVLALVVMLLAGASCARSDPAGVELQIASNLDSSQMSAFRIRVRTESGTELGPFGPYALADHRLPRSFVVRPLDGAGARSVLVEVDAMLGEQVVVTASRRVGFTDRAAYGCVFLARACLGSLGSRTGSTAAPAACQVDDRPLSSVPDPSCTAGETSDGGAAPGPSTSPSVASGDGGPGPEGPSNPPAPVPWYDDTIRHRVALTVTNDAQVRVDYPIEYEVDFSAFGQGITADNFDVNSVRVVEHDAATGHDIAVPSWYAPSRDPGPASRGVVFFVLTGTTSATQTRTFELYFDAGTRSPPMMPETTSVAGPLFILNNLSQSGTGGGDLGIGIGQTGLAPNGQVGQGAGLGGQYSRISSQTGGFDLFTGSLRQLGPFTGRMPSYYVAKPAWRTFDGSGLHIAEMWGTLAGLSWLNVSEFVVITTQGWARIYTRIQNDSSTDLNDVKYFDVLTPVIDGSGSVDGRVPTGATSQLIEFDRMGSGVVIMASSDATPDGAEVTATNSVVQDMLDGVVQGTQGALKTVGVRTGNVGLVRSWNLSVKAGTARGLRSAIGYGPSPSAQALGPAMMSLAHPPAVTTGMPEAHP